MQPEACERLPIADRPRHVGSRAWMLDERHRTAPAGCPPPRPRAPGLAVGVAALAPAVCRAQDVDIEARLERAERYHEALRTLAGGRVQPVWVPDQEAFVYRAEAGPRTGEWVRVDAL